MNFLINTDGQIPSTQLLQKENKEYIEIANADYFVPAIWLLLFKQSDLKEVKIETQDFDGNPCFDVVQMPITSVDSALKNLKESKEFFLDAFDCDRSLLQDYFDNALNLLTGFEFKNLALDSTEYLICQLEEDEWSLLFTALGCDTKAIDAIMELSGYESGVSPFSVSELYENPSLSRGSQLGNANALDVHCSSIDYRFRFKPEISTNKQFNRD
ncbi:hypothetical protein C1E23_03445 [Pseudoalteromonas phenolica]|uniref:Uncharacterized protein n=1 Tax=Pseudoalteromonas phenolica TaxID=161398 RepID=A0A4Q7ITD4_9GAMM|nr:hypothetical protein [Pseudoalteromonas phenolica]RZQ54487.1 hypothetical protein C1E23_03445 [Pseudoalteromonas phenolica]